MLQSDIVRSQDGVDRCNRKVWTAVQNVKGDDSKGYHNIEAYCGMPITVRISDNVRGCSRCDKEPPVGNVHPRTINSASIPLTAKELSDCGVSEDPSLKSEIKSSIATTLIEKPVEGKKMEISKDEIVLTIPLSILEGHEDIASYLIQKSSEALDDLPVTNFKESKRLIRVQEKLESLLRV